MDFIYQNQFTLESGSPLMVKFITAADQTKLDRFQNALSAQSVYTGDDYLDLYNLRLRPSRADGILVATIEQPEPEMVGLLSLHRVVEYGEHKNHVVRFHIQVLPRPDAVEIARILLKALIQWGGTQSDIHKLQLITLSWNERALDVFRDVGFVLEGRDKRGWKVTAKGGKVYFLDGVSLGLWLGNTEKRKR